MKKYLPHIIEALTGPISTFNKNVLSPARVFNKRKVLAECKKKLKYRKE